MPAAVAMILYNVYNMGNTESRNILGSGLFSWQFFPFYANLTGMARPLRIQYSGAVYHVTSRGNDRKAVFRDEEDWDAFLRILHQVNRRYHWICHAYCLMDNHYHLLIETPDGNISLGMRQLNGVYTQAFNHRQGRSGHLFQGRYKAILIQKESHLLEVSRYIVLNPVRAGFVKDPKDWPWCSYLATAGIKKPHPCLTRNWILKQLSEDMEKAGKQYRDFVLQGSGKKTIWTEVKGQILLGGANFVEHLMEHLRGHEKIPEIPKGQRFLSRPELGKIFPSSILARKGKRDEMIEEAVERYGYTQREVSEFLGLHFTSISRILKQRTEMQRK
jgi:putative transposase